MKARTLNSLLLLGFGLLFFCGAKDTDILYWNADKRLSWDDFAGEPRFDYEGVAALTSSGIVHYKGCKDNNINYRVRAYFEKHESWVKEEALTTHHLRHEQLHFDITELFARKLRKVLSERAFKCGQEEEFETFVSAYLENWRNEQQKYDLLSRHSMDRATQKEWYYKIAMELSLLEDFKEPLKK
ncbi:MAG: hypothetical protein AB8G15_10340 [Saprospiraceae bacterium]